MIFDKTLWQPNDRKKEELVPGGEEKVFILQIIYWGKHFVSLMCWWGLFVPQSMELSGPDMDYNRIHFLRSKHWDLVLTRAKCWASRPSNGITLVDPNQLSTFSRVRPIPITAPSLEVNCNSSLPSTYFPRLTIFNHKSLIVNKIHPSP